MSPDTPGRAFPSPGTTLTLAWSGTAAGATALLPGVRRLRDARPEARFLLLWPSHLRPVAGLDSLVQRAIRYPVERADAGSLRQSIEALRAASGANGAAVIFTEVGWSADVPAYVAYFAHIRIRYGFEAEFGGRVLSHAASEPAARGALRHLHLLRTHGLLEERDAPTEQPGITGRGEVCAP